MAKWKRSPRTYDPPPPRSVNSCWKFWRHFICRAGYYPALVAPVLTCGFILSMYSSLGCDFIKVTVGFTPSNQAWNESQAELGLFFHVDAQADHEHENRYREFLHDGCVWYDDIFDTSIVTRDRTWKVARVISMVAAASGLLAFVTIWILLLCPLPIGCIWPAILLPSTMLSFISEGSKFLFLDIALCRNAVWFPSGVDSLPERAENCTLGMSGYVAVAAGSIYLVALLLVCLNSPQKRELDPNYGVEYDEDPEFMDAASTEQADYGGQSNMLGMDPASFSADPSPSSTRIDTNGTTSIGSLTAETPEYGYQPVQPPSQPPPIDPYPFKPAPLLNSPVRTMEPDDKPCSFVSESRMAVMSKMRLCVQSSESHDMIEQLCSDLDSSLAPSGSMGK